MTPKPFELNGSPVVPGAEGDKVTLKGKLTMQHAEQLGTGDAYYWYELHRPEKKPVKLVSGASTELSFNVLGATTGRDGIEEQLRSADGAIVRVAGVVQGDGVKVQSIQQLTTFTGWAPHTGAVKVAVILFNFTDDRSRPWTKAEAEGYTFTNPNSANQHFQMSSEGQVSLTGDVFDWVETSEVKAGCGTSGTWYSSALAAVAAANPTFNPDDYDILQFAFPQEPSCGYSGLAWNSTGNQPTSWINGSLQDVHTQQHELWHNLGLQHANSLSCKRGIRNVAIAPAGCASVEYGDPFDVMGRGQNLLHNNHRGVFDYIPAANTTTIGADGDYPLKATETILPPGNTQVLRVPRPYDSAKPFYELELRDTYNPFDDFAIGAPATNGVSIRISAPAQVPEASQPVIVDTTPQTATFDDAPLAVGETFYDPYADFTITTVSAGFGQAVVNFTAGPPPGLDSITIAGGVATIAVSSNRDHNIGVELAEEGLLIDDASNGVTAPPGCNQVYSNEVLCPADGVNSIVLNGGDGDDVLSVGSGAPAATINGGAGNDTLSSARAADTLDGGDGNDNLDAGGGKDVLIGGPGVDVMRGGSGDDRFDGGPGGDDFHPSSGFDTFDYSQRTNTIGYYGNGNYLGETNELDRTFDEPERILGGSANDQMLRNSWEAAVTFVGGAGEDYLSGGGGADTLIGGAGLDTLIGNDGDDLLDASDASVDDLTCGNGVDTAKHSVGDTVNPGCEVVDTTPETSIDSTPAALSSDTTPTFTFSSSLPTATFECAIDAAAFAACTSPHTPTVATGAHTFRVRAKAGATVDSTPATFAFTVDTTAPDTSITSAAPVGYDNTPRFALGSTDADAKFECSMDMGAYGRCSFAYAAPELTDGSHTLRVRSIDLSGNADATPATQTFTIAALGPVRVASGVLQFTAPAGRANNIQIQLLGSAYIVTDISGAIAAGAGCTSLQSNQVSCPSAGVTSVFMAGGDMNDSILPTFPSDTFDMIAEGGAGDDTLTGGAGTDRFAGGPGSDTIVDNGVDQTVDVVDGGSGSDNFAVAGPLTIDYSDRVTDLNLTFGYDTVVGGSPGERDLRVAYLNFEPTVLGGAGDDHMQSPFTGTVLKGGTGDDTLKGFYYAMAFEGGAGADSITGAMEGDTINGGPGRDVLDGFAGNDVFTDDTAVEPDEFIGGDGIDTVSYSNRTVAITASIDGAANDGASGEGDSIDSGVENLTGGSAADTLTGDANANALSGGGGADTLNGGDGDDTLDGGAANDTFNAGNGFDTVTYASRSAAQSLTFDGAANDGDSTDGTTTKDNLGATVEAVIGGSGNDTLAGTTIAHSLYGDGGNDTITSGTGTETIDGGAGVDTVSYSVRTTAVTVNNTAVGLDGVSGENDNVTPTIENVTTGSAADTITTGPESNVLNGGSGNDTLNGGDGNDSFVGGTGADVFNGGAGVDVADYSARTTAQTVTINGTANDGDSTDGSTTRDNVKTDVENVTGGSGADSLSGTSGTSNVANTLTGGSGNDTLNGLDGNDVLTGGMGVDTISGGTGDDSIDLVDGVNDGTVTCGTGTVDRVTADQTGDAVNADCEIVTRP